MLAAKTLGFEPKNCLVVEDSPFGIQAGVAAGGKTIAVSTSHAHEKSRFLSSETGLHYLCMLIMFCCACALIVSHCGATWLIPTLELVQVEVLADGRIRIFIDATAAQVEKAISESVRGKIAAMVV